jgi:methylenetetrahydrofolate reductase (NADPH)
LPLAKTMAEQKDLCGGLALTDLRDAPWSALEIAAALPEELRTRNICFVSGDGRNAAAAKTQHDLALSCGAVNIVPVSGNGIPFSVRECRNRDYCSSVAQLQMLRERDVLAGTVFNPFCYDGCTALAVYNALENKISAGAQFVITQSGWDMLNNQAVAWYLLRRKQYLPMIAHLTLLTPDRVEKIIAGEIPGVRMNAAFRKLISRELLGSKAQFEAAQYRRLELQVAGCRHMGYSGVIVSGVDVPGRAALVASRIRSALQEFRSFEHFLSEYNEHQASAEMGSGFRAFHMFDRVLRRQYSFDDPPEISEPGDCGYSFCERMGYRLKKFLFAKADRMRPGRDIVLKKLLVQCRSCDACSLPQHNFYCIKNCPKRLVSGPCGGVNSDGMCEISGNECIFVRIMRCERYLRSKSGLESGR